ncbi:MAG: hypothetical protein EXX96DRAFT_588724 [Benjaminiella poitrasii]|nr:MAG: hypothetical protein EXX96DRAFT_588724 [Benjaminiella poitrasii]
MYAYEELKLEYVFIFMYIVFILSINHFNIFIKKKYSTISLYSYILCVLLINYSSCRINVEIGEMSLKVDGLRESYITLSTAARTSKPRVSYRIVGDRRVIRIKCIVEGESLGLEVTLYTSRELLTNTRYQKILS